VCFSRFARALRIHLSHPLISPETDLGDVEYEFLAVYSFPVVTFSLLDLNIIFSCCPHTTESSLDPSGAKRRFHTRIKGTAETTVLQDLMLFLGIRLEDKRF
jgi:hypothetical protein